MSHDGSPRTPADHHRELVDAGQMTLEDVLADLDRQAEAGDRQATIRARFLRFHRDNPAVYDELVEMARALKARGHERFGLRMLWETLRWRRMLETVDPTGYKLNDHYIAHYARLIMDREDDLDGLFETRQIRTA